MHGLGIVVEIMKLLRFVLRSDKVHFDEIAIRTTEVQKEYVDRVAQEVEGLFPVGFVMSKHVHCVNSLS